MIRWLIYIYVVVMLHSVLNLSFHPLQYIYSFIVNCCCIVESSNSDMFFFHFSLSPLVKTRYTCHNVSTCIGNACVYVCLDKLDWSITFLSWFEIVTQMTTRMWHTLVSDWHRYFKRSTSQQARHRWDLGDNDLV